MREWWNKTISAEDDVGTKVGTFKGDIPEHGSTNARLASNNYETLHTL